MNPGAGTLIEEALPRYDAVERHSKRVPASPEAAFAALERLRIADLPVTAALLRLRGGPANWFVGLGEAGRMRALDAIAPRRIAEHPGRELLLGDIARYAALHPERPSEPPSDVAGFAAFDTPGWSKVAMNFAFTAQAGATLVRTETRVRSTDPRTRRIFSVYWRIVGKGSALIRREILAALARALANGGQE
ncbi:hypothetical protein [Sciscionella sediminilitoris]|uniref:hypothetical protein n=1 Tax=Sciscionella sediminilitoris TaxID=1445613 RepID=UPI0004DF797F|nr:hypothetical protein [Sciscionella sp. SE31]